MNGLLQVVLFFKRWPFRANLAVIGVGMGLLGWLFVPDLMYDIAVSKAKVFTIEQLVSMKEEDIPRYLIVKDARTVAGDYVETLSGGTDPTAITYPIYSSNQLTNASDTLISSVVCQLVLVDRNVTRKDLDSGNYFGSDRFFIQGKYNGRFDDTTARGILKRTGYSISPTCIEIEKGTEPLPAWSCVLFSIVAIFLAGCAAMSFLSKDKLYDIFRQKRLFEL